MPLLKSTRNPKKTILSVVIKPNLADEIDAYCKWADISTKALFATQAFSYVLENDKEWRKFWHKLRQLNKNPPDKLRGILLNTISPARTANKEE